MIIYHHQNKRKTLLAIERDVYELFVRSSHNYHNWSVTVGHSVAVANIFKTHRYALDCNKNIIQKEVMVVIII